MPSEIPLGSLFYQQIIESTLIPQLIYAKCFFPSTLEGTYNLHHGRAGSTGVCHQMPLDRLVAPD